MNRSKIKMGDIRIISPEIHNNYKTKKIDNYKY